MAARPCAAPAARRATSPSTAPTTRATSSTSCCSTPTTPRASIRASPPRGATRAHSARRSRARCGRASTAPGSSSRPSIAETLASNELPPLFDWIKERSALFRGALLNTILRNDTFYFNQLGTFLERADNTARILDVKYYVLLPHSEMVGGEIDSVQWAAILRSVSAHRSYRWVYKDSYKPWQHRRLSDPQPADAALAAVLLRGDRCRRSTSSARFYGNRNGCQSARARDAAAAGGGRHERHLPVRACTSSWREFIARNNRLGSEISTTYHFAD